LNKITSASAVVASTVALSVAGCNLSAAKPATAEPQAAAHAAHQTQDTGKAGTTILRSGKYEIELRVHAEGLFAGEEVDVEFRVTDSTQKDPVESGNKGVPNVEASGVVTMPSMPGMPEQRPDIHREGVPGDYGIVLFFPHGGPYEIALRLKPPGAEAFTVKFLVDVKDERPSAAQGELPYELKVVDWPSGAMSGSPVNLQLQVIERKSGQAAKEFDIAHEKRFHLLLASRDLNWFLHEHPEMGPDGTWSIPITFPAGGEYWVYGDVAPSGKGSRVLIAKVNLNGPNPTWDTTLRIQDKADDGGLHGALRALDQPIPLGKTTELEVKLTDGATGAPAGDTVKWLGAAGHMMIFHEDGTTVVHSHPAEDAESESLVKSGVVRFSGRFPKPGKYKVYAQFDWRGAVRTLGFGIDVKE
jgi:hypothetical protein